MFDKKVASGGAYFKPSDWADQAAILIEPVSFRPNQPNPFEPGKTRDELVADMTVFSSDGKHKVLERQTVTNGGLTKDLPVGGKYLQKLGKYATKKGNPAWIWEDATDAKAIKAAEKYVTERDADLDDAPDLD